MFESVDSAPIKFGSSLSEPSDDSSFQSKLRPAAGAGAEAPGAPNVDCDDAIVVADVTVLNVDTEFVFEMAVCCWHYFG